MDDRELLRTVPVFAEVGDADLEKLAEDLEHLLEGWDENPPTADPSYCGIRGQHFLYTEYGDGSQELYDTRTDPWEIHNLIGNPAYHREFEKLHAMMLRDCSPPPMQARCARNSRALWRSRQSTALSSGGSATALWPDRPC